MAEYISIKITNPKDFKYSNNNLFFNKLERKMNVISKFNKLPPITHTIIDMEQHFNDDSKYILSDTSNSQDSQDSTYSFNK